MTLISIWSSRITAKKIYRAGIIGCGRIGSLLEKDPLREKPCTHAGAYHKHERVELVAGCDINKERLEEFKADWKVESLYEDYGKLLSETKLDIVSIATEISNHPEIVIEAARNAVPVIVCEKPIAPGLEIAREMVKECEKMGSFLLINHERRFASDYAFVKGMIERGDIGELVSIRGRMLTGSPKDGTDCEVEGGGPLLHDGTHLIDVIRYLSGSEVDWVYGDMSEKPGIRVEETLWGMMGLKSGVRVMIEAGGRRNYFVFEVELEGTEGKISIGNGLLKWWRTRKSKLYSGFYDLVEEDIPQFDMSPQFSNEVEAVIRYLDEGTLPGSSGWDGYHALEAIYALYESAIKKKVLVVPPVGVDFTPLKGYFS